MKKLTLKVDEKHFQDILNGTLKKEERFIYPNNIDRYITEEENPDGSVNVNPIPYDAIKFIRGRKPNAPTVVVEVLSSQFVILTDENDNDITFEENGETYVVCQVWYTLGKLLESENIENNKN